MEKQILVKRIITFSILALIVIGLFCLQLSIAKQSKENLPNAIAIRSSKGLSLTLSDTQLLKDNVAAVSQLKGAIATPICSDITTVNICKTTPNYGKIIPLDFIYGNYFVESKNTIGNRYIVISDTLAIKYFQTDNVVGNDVLLEDLSYTICGIYNNSQKLISRLAGSGLETVYVSPQSVTDDKLPINTLYVNEKTEFVDKVINDIALLTGKPLFQDNVSNFNDINKIISQAPKITLSFMAWIISIIIIWIAIKQGKLAYNYYKNDDKKSTLIYCAITALMIIIVIVLLWSTHFTVFLPSQILPDDNIFDFKHYIDIIVISVNRYNNYPIHDYHWSYSFLAVVSSIVITAITLITASILWIYSVVKLKGYFKENRG